MKHKIIIIFFILFLQSSNLFSQCFCGDITLCLILPDLKLEDDSSNYSVKTITEVHYLNNIKNWEKIKKGGIRRGNLLNLERDTVYFQFLTEGGIDTLKFIIRNDNTNEEMNITVTHMGHDIPYFIDLTIFSKGNYLFDWYKIDKCLPKNLTEEIIECEGMKFYQTQLKGIGRGKFNNYITPWQIKSYSLEYFEEK